MSELRKTELFSFAFFPDFNLAISELAELAEPEAWDFSDEPPELRSNKILKITLNTLSVNSSLTTKFLFIKVDDTLVSTLGSIPKAWKIFTPTLKKLE